MKNSLKSKVSKFLVTSLLWLPILAAAENEYKTRSVINCDSKEISVVSYCSLDKDDYPICKKQQLVFKDGPKIKTFTYLPEVKKYQQPLIGKISCIKNNKEHYVLIENTNYANCKQGCEWVDLYDLNGIYLGSTKGLASALPFKRKKIPAKRSSLLKKSIVISESFVSRVEEK